MNKTKLKGNLLLLSTAAVWGIAFVAQRVGMEYIGPLTFNGIRFAMAAIVLIPVAYFLERRPQRLQEIQTVEITADGQQNSSAIHTPETRKKQKRTLMIASLVCSIILFCGSTLQQMGIVTTSAGKTAFITALYIVLVPIFSMVLKHRPSLKCWIGVVFGTIGLYFLCITSTFDIAPGDLIVLIGAGFWACHILAIDYFLSKLSSPISMSMYQFALVAVISLIGAVIFEEISLSAILSSMIPLLYAGIMSGGVGFTFQILGQKHTNPTVASLILSLEAVFGAIFGFLILNEVMSTRELAGCILMFCAIIMSQLPDRKKPQTL